MTLTTVLTNNIYVLEYLRNDKSLKVTFIGGSVQKVISACESVLSSGKYKLAADIMSGRRARPFPFVTVILIPSKAGPSYYDWNRVADYSELNNRRVGIYSTYSEDFLADYRTLDLSLTKASLQYLNRIHTSDFCNTN